MSKAKLLKFPLPKRDTSASAPVAASMSAFHREVMSRDLVSAQRVLQSALGVDGKLAERCTAYYADKVTLDAEHVRQAMSLHEIVAGGRQAEAVLTLRQCFDLHDAEALEIFRRLSRTKTAR